MLEAGVFGGSDRDCEGRAPLLANAVTETHTHSTNQGVALVVTIRHGGASMQAEV
jgi:hypothetical protein